MRHRRGGSVHLAADPDLPAVAVEGLTVRFRLYHERPSGLKERLYRFRRTTSTEFNALEDVTFTVRHGEAVAIIGHNGSGKSTLLRLLARILPPDEGTVMTNGRVASLLELGAGFHGDLTGRENIYLNGAILGLSRSQIDARFDEIVDLAGIRPLLDTAVRTYSSGLYVRLGFAVAVIVEPDILLVDEVLAVGDAEFQVRSLERMQRFNDEGKTVLLVSHDLDAVREVCDRVIVLDRGRVVFDGPVDDGVDHYRARIAQAAARTAPREPTEERRATIREALLLDDEGVLVGVVPSAGPVSLRIGFQAHEDIDACVVGFTVHDELDRLLYRYHSGEDDLAIGPIKAGESAQMEFDFIAPRRSGDYWVTARLADARSGELWSKVPIDLPLRVGSHVGRRGRVDLGVTARITAGRAVDEFPSPEEGQPIEQLEGL